MKKLILFPLLFLLPLVGCSGETPTHQLSFDPNGGSGTMEMETHHEGERFELPLSTFSKNRYDFAGWSTSANGVVEYSDGGYFIMPTEDTTLYAKWDFAGYYINFDPNGGEGTMERATVKSGEQFTLPKGTFEKHNYRVSGWALTANGAQAYADEETITMGSKDITLYAVYSFIGYTLTYSANGGTGEMPEEHYTIGETITTVEPPFTKEGMIFAGWSMSSDGSNMREVGDNFYMPGNDATLYAVWINEDATISFNANGGSGEAMPSIDAKIGSEITIPECTYRYTDKTFVGWALTSSATSAIVQAGESWTVIRKNNITLYAVWQGAKTLIVHPNTWRSDTLITYNQEYTNYKGGERIPDLIQAFGVPTPIDGATFVGYRPAVYNNPTDEILNDWTVPSASYSIKCQIFAQLINFTNFDRYTEIKFDYASASNADSDLYPNALKLDFILSIHNTLDKVVVDWGDGTNRDSYGTEEFLFDKEDTHYILSHTFATGLTSDIITVKIAGAIDSLAVYRPDGENTISSGHKFIKKIRFDESIRYLKPFGASYGAFEGCESLYYVDMPDAIYEVGPRAFKNCTALNNLYFPHQKQEKADYTNREMLGIQIFDTGTSTLNIIGDEAFAGLTSLKTLFLPLNSVGDTAGEMGSNILTGYTGILYHILSQSREQSRYGSTISSWAGSNITIKRDVGNSYYTGGTLSTGASSIVQAYHATPGIKITLKRTSGSNITIRFYDGTTYTFSGSYTYIIPNVEHMFFYLYTSSTTVSGLQIDRDYSYRP